MKVICEKCKKEFEYDNEYYLNEPFQCTECDHINYVLDFY
jgi:DNA-directed RNA polymerase subunit RPC12/RpoP